MFFSLFPWSWGVKCTCGVASSNELCLRVCDHNDEWMLRHGQRDNALCLFSGNRPSRVSWWGDLSEALEADVVARLSCRHLTAKHIQDEAQVREQKTNVTGRAGEERPDGRASPSLWPFQFTSPSESSPSAEASPCDLNSHSYHPF